MKRLSKKTNDGTEWLLFTTPGGTQLLVPDRCSATYTPGSGLYINHNDPHHTETWVPDKDIVMVRTKDALPDITCPNCGVLTKKSHYFMDEEDQVDYHSGRWDSDSDPSYYHCDAPPSPE